MENLAPISPGADAIERLVEGLNPPQRRAVEYGEGPLLVIAGAGSGKTRVLTRRIAFLVATGQAHPSEILAITFTNKAAQEMRNRVEELVGGVSRLMWVMTFHSACARLLRANAERLGYKRSFTIYDQADSLRMVKRCIEENDVDPKRFTPRSVQSAISGAKNRLEDSTDYAENQATYFEQVVSEVYSLYERRMVEASAMDFDDLLVRTVNLFELFADVRERYQRTFRWLLVDEYQDTNRAQYRLLQLLAGEQKNLTVVGDDAQCVSEGTSISMADGSKRPVERIEIGDEVLSSYGSGDFRAATVEGVYRAFEENGTRITTQGGRELTSTREHMHFAGYQLGRTPQMHLSYLMWKRGSGFRVGTTRVYTAGQRKPVIGIRLRCFTEAADAVWVLSNHENEVEARLAEAVTAAKYGLPTLPFVARKGSNATHSMVASQSHLDQLFSSVDTETAGHRLIEDEGLSFQHPHHQAGAFTGRRRVVTLTMCAERRNRMPMHRLSMAISEPADKEALERIGLSVRPAKQQAESWKYETCVRDFTEAVRVVGRISSELDIAVRCVGRFGDNAQGQYGTNSLPCIPAASVRPGMAMFLADGTYDVVKSVETVEMQKPVYDIDVAETHNFVANGLVTHNSIYSFRSADVRNILEFEHDFDGAEVVKLEQNYRSTGTILDAANAVIANNTEQKQKNLWTDAGRGEPVVVAELDDEHAEARYVAGEIERLVSDEDYGRDDIAVFYRMNAQSRVLEDTLVRYEVPYQVIGGTKFYERAEVKDAIAYLSLLANPADAISFTRVINSPRRGIGQTSESRILSHVNTTGEDVWDVMSRPESVPGLGSAAVKAVSRFAAVMAGLRERSEGDSVAELLESVLHDTGYFDSLEAERTLEAEGRMENLQELVGVAGEFDVNRKVEGEEREDTPLEEFLAQIRLFTEQDGLRDTESLITLMSLHNAKGLEYDAAFIIGCEEGVFPHARSVEEGNLEEERRLAYVGVTRAKLRLYMTCARRRSLHGSSGWNLPSRFLREVPDELVDKKAMAVQTGWQGERAGGSRRDTVLGFGGAGEFRAPSRAQPQSPEVEFRIGDDVIHASFGEGVVTSVEPGSVVVVRFASEGGERKLMADYAPLKKAS
jgi:DNA helicase-2/ATP-dependent DNA helicase PcrA